MKTPLPLLTAALTALSAHASLIPLTIDRSVSVSGSTPTSSYSQTVSSTELGTFNQDISDSRGPTGALAIHADSQAHQTSTITPNGFLIDTLLRGFTSTNFDFPTPQTTSTATSTFDFTFTTTEPQLYTFTSTLFATQVPTDIIPRPTGLFSLSTPASLVLNGALPAETRTGILPPNTYTFHFLTDLVTGTDPLGNLKLSESHLSFNVESVPDTGSTLLLLAIPLTLLFLKNNLPKHD
jgi:hypothetical protein